MLTSSNRSAWSRAACSLASVCAVLSCFGISEARADVLKAGDTVEVIGDSITEQKLYSVMIEDYLLMCQPTKVRVMQFGWSGEQASGLLSRIADPLTFKPNVITTCYGMNDGHYQPITDEIRDNYKKNMTEVMKRFADAGATVVIGGPGAVDTKSFKRSSMTPEQYNENLATLSGVARELAKQHGWPFADVHDHMIDAMKAAKAKLGEGYIVAGGDGIHPRPNGHLIMAYSFLKAMGFDGNLGEIDVDLPLAHAEVTGPHKVVDFKKGELTITSTRYPFCFTAGKGDKDPESTATMTQFIPFNQDLNRLTLKVTAPAGKYKVTWGKASNEYTADQLKAGINLAADFVDNPFHDAFFAVQSKIQEQQNAETPLLKGLLHNLDQSDTLLPNAGPEVAALVKKIVERQGQLFDAAAGAVQPVTHTIKIEAIQ